MLFETAVEKNKPWKQSFVLLKISLDFPRIDTFWMQNKYNTICLQLIQFFFKKPPWYNRVSQTKKGFAAESISCQVNAV